MKITINKNQLPQEIELIINTNADDFNNWQSILKEKYELDDKLSKEIFINDLFQAAISKYNINFYNVAHLQVKENPSLVFEIKTVLKILPQIDIKNWQSKIDKKLIAKIKNANSVEKIDIANQIIKNIVDQYKKITIPNELILQETAEVVQNLEQEILPSELSKNHIENEKKYKQHLQKYILYKIKTALVIKELAKELAIYETADQKLNPQQSNNKNMLYQQWLNNKNLISKTQKAIIKALDK